MEIVFPFKLKEHVAITSLEVYGLVDALKITNLGIEIGVIYWYNGERKSIWVYPEELEKIQNSGA